jgi:quinohemoprotein ethanol dehydrogenase
VLEGDSAERAARGAALFARHCARCHAARGEARLSSYPDLFRLSADVHARFDAIVRGGALAPAGMASFADVLSEADARALHSYLVREQALLRREEQGG